MCNRSTSRSMVGLASAALLLGCQSVDAPVDDGKQWGTPEVIDDAPALPLRAQVAMDPMGNAIAVWDQTDRTTGSADSSDDIWSNRTDAEGRWGVAELIENREPDDSLEPQIAVDAEGNALVVFRQSEVETSAQGQGRYRVWSLRYTPRDGWNGTPELIESNDAGDASRPQIAMNAQGDAVVVWQQDDATDESVAVWANRFIVGDGWRDAAPVQTNPNVLLGPQVAIDANGNAIVVWEGIDDENRSSIWSRRLTPDGGREALLNVETDDSGNASFPQVAADSEGNAIAVWQQDTGEQRFDIWSSRYSAATGEWESAVRIGPQDAGDASKPQVAIDGDGNAVAVWAQSGGSRAGVWSNRYAAGVGWGNARPVGRTGLGAARLAQVSTNADGDAVAVWVQFDGIEDRVWSNRYSVGVGWGTSEPIDNQDELRATGPQVAVDLEGNAVAVWQEGIGLDFDLWSNRLD